MVINSHFAAVMAGVIFLASTFTASAEEHEVRTGVVAAMQALAPKPAVFSNRQKRDLGGMLGYAVGQATGGNGAYAFTLTQLATDMVAGKGDNVKTADYMVVVRFDDASESMFTRSESQLARIHVGSRVRVVGSGDGATLLAE